MAAICCLCCSSDEAGRGLGKVEGGSNLETKVKKGQEQGGALEGQETEILCSGRVIGAAFFSNFLVISFPDILTVGRTPHGEVLLYHPHWRGFAEGRGEGGCSPAPELTSFWKAGLPGHSTVPAASMYLT